jgi:hypothetical protein
METTEQDRMEDRGEGVTLEVIPGAGRVGHSKGQPVMISLTNEDILLRLSNREDSTVERKTASDYGDCRKTAVAFSNSLPIGDPGILFVGVYDDGTVESSTNLESLQNKVSKEFKKIYPAIYPQSRVMSKDGKEFLAVIVRGSENRPHFAGQSYIRDGTQSIPASQEQFNNLIAERNSKAYAIGKWKGKIVTVTEPMREMQIHATTQYVPGRRTTATLFECNQFYVTVESTMQKDRLLSLPLRVVEINFDHGERRLELQLLEGQGQLPVPF